MPRVVFVAVVAALLRGRPRRSGKSRFLHYYYYFYYHDSRRKSRRIGKRPQGLRGWLKLSGIERVRGAAVVEDSKKTRDHDNDDSNWTSHFYPSVHDIITVIVVVAVVAAMCVARFDRGRHVWNSTEDRAAWPYRYAPAAVNRAILDKPL